MLQITKSKPACRRASMFETLGNWDLDIVHEPERSSVQDYPEVSFALLRGVSYFGFRISDLIGLVSEI